MTRTEFDALIGQAVAAVEPAYDGAITALVAAGSEVDPWLAELAAAADWRQRTVAQAAELRRSDAQLIQDIESILAGQREPGGPRPVGGKLSQPRRATMLAAIGPRAAPRLIEIMVHGHATNPEAVPVASQALRQMGEQRAIDPLMEAARTGEAMVSKSMAIALLGWMRAPEVADVARAAAQDATAAPSVRTAAFTALGQLRETQSAPVMLAAATSPREDTTVRESAVRAIGMLGSSVTDAAVAALGVIARSGDIGLAATALEAVRQVETPAARTLLAELDPSSRPAPGAGDGETREA